MTNHGVSERPPQIRAEHLAKLAVIYIRQSSLEQVRQHIGSTLVQLELADRARQYGWPDARIKVIDHDLGLSGTSSAHRLGFQEMLELIAQGEVGMVFVHDSARLSRSTLDHEVFLVKAMQQGVLIEVNGRIFDTANADLADLFSLKIQALLAWFENASRVRTFRMAKAAKVRKGYAVSPPPMGFVESVKGKWVMDESPVREALERLFDLYLRLKAVRKVVQYHHEHNLLFPHRFRGALRWEPLTELSVSHILRNPNYTSHYVYFRAKSSRPLQAGQPWSQRRPRSEWVIYENHHAGYSTWEQWEEIQTILDNNRKRRRPPVLDGPGLLQGSIWCGGCDRPIRTLYHRKVKTGHLPAYRCRPANRLGTTTNCFWAPAEILDVPVVREVLKALTPVGLSDAQRVIQDTITEWESLQRARTARLREAEHTVEDVRREYKAVDPAHQLVKADLAGELEAAIGARDQLKHDYARRRPTPPVTMTPENLAELLARAADIDTLWTAPTTTNRDRKHLLQTVVRRVVVRDATEDWIDLEIVWAGGLREAHRVIWRRGLRTYVEELKDQGQSGTQIVRTLQSSGVLNRDGRLIKREVVAKHLRDLGVTQQARMTAAFLRIWDLLIARYSDRQILEEVQQNGPPHWRGTWNYRLVQDYIRRLRKGHVPPGVPPLPPGSARLAETPADVKTLIITWRAGKWRWRVVAEELNRRGVRPARGNSFTADHCASLYRAWQRTGKL